MSGLNGVLLTSLVAVCFTQELVVLDDVMCCGLF